MKLLPFGLVCLLGITSAFSATPRATPASGAKGDFAVRGAGLVDCRTYLTERKQQSRAYVMMGGWIDGYLTGINQFAPDTFDVASYESTELYAKLVAERCKTRPEDRLFTVMDAIVKRHWADRITRRSPRVTITGNGRTIRLYRATIERLQTRLKNRGFLASTATGTFDAATRRALSAFQKTLKGYKPTGFPDQATLYMLFEH